MGTETKQEEKQPLQEQTTNKQVEKEKPKNLDDGEEEWVEVNKGKSHYEKREYHNGRGGRGRGGRGRGGRGGKRGDGQLERKKENDRPEGEQNLKQVGTKDNVEVNDAPVQQVESQE